MTDGYNGEICLLLESNFLCNFKLICPVQSPGQKESTLLVGQIITTSPPRPAPLPRGASPSSRNVGRGMRWTLQLKRRMSLKRTAKPRGPGAPWLASSWRRCFCIAPMTVTNTSRTPGRARRKPLKPIACGNAGYLRWTCGDYARVLSHFGREAAGAIAHPAFSTPSKRGGSAQGSGVLRREIAQP